MPLTSAKLVSICGPEAEFVSSAIARVARRTRPRSSGDRTIGETSRWPGVGKGPLPLTTMVIVAPDEFLNLTDAANRSG
jgi:hypothetical protein